MLVKFFFVYFSKVIDLFVTILFVPVGAEKKTFKMHFGLKFFFF
jgi:hypothetical protein